MEATTYKINPNFVAAPPTLALPQRSFRWYQNADSVSPTAPLAVENAVYAAIALGEVYRLRMSVKVGGLAVSTGSQIFKLQYATSTGGPWSDVGAIGSGGTWRGYDNTTPADGATITFLLLSNSNVAESYEEANPSPNNPNAISPGQRGEWDWVLQHNGASPSVTYYFQMAKSSGVVLDTYTRYPTLTTTYPTIAWDNFESGGWSGGGGLALPLVSFRRVHRRQPRHSLPGDISPLTSGKHRLCG